MIWTSLRFLPSAAILRDMDACLATKARFPHLVAGYDLVGQEDAGRPLRDLVPELLWFRAQCASEGLEIPLVLHAGETLGTGTDADLNVLDALLLGTRRIGHAFSLHKHPVLLNLVRERRVCVEACPVSNEVLRLCSSILSHPLPALLARGVPCALSNDDPAMLGHDTAGNSHDLCQALNGWQNLGLEGLGSLAENSVRFALFEDESKETWDRGVREASLGEGLRARRLKEWAIAWEKFCLWIVEEFGDEWEESEAAEKVEEKMAA